MKVVTSNLLIFVTLFVSENNHVLGFAPEARTRLSTTLTKSSKLFGASLPMFTEDEAFYQMQKARECALSDTCSVDDAKDYLSGVLHVQGGCASGTLAGQSICEGDQSEIAETVALLRQKIDKNSGVMMLSNNMSMLVNNPIMTSALSIVIFYFFLITLSTIDFNQGATPFTFQEWYWAIRDGYVSQMMGHYFRNGGLEASATSLTPQEWYWAMKDGYFGTMMGHYFRNGGLEASATSLTPQEWYWAMRDGYLGDMMGHYFRNGGLEQSATSFTPEEWYMATKGGYVGDMIGHYFRNGGL